MAEVRAAPAPPQGRPRVLLIDEIDAEAARRLEQVAEVVRPHGRTTQDLQAAIRDVEGAIVRTTPLPRAVIERADRLRVIAKHGVGVDAIDLDCATERGIVVGYAPGVNAAAVAEFALTCILLLLKPALRAPTRRDGTLGATHAGAQRDAEMLPRELSSVRTGILGWGNIGRRVGAAVKLLGGHVSAYDPVIAATEIAAGGAHPAASLGDLLAEADVLSIHVPLAAATRGMIGAGELAQMPAGGVLVNTARGGVVDEVALADAIGQGHLRGAAVDVFAAEPPDPRHPLLWLDGVICTGHLAGTTASTLRAMADCAVNAVISVLSGGRPADVANPDVLAR